jgi:TIR domain
MNPNQSKPKANFLRLVEPRPGAATLSHDTFARPGWQSTLFANEHSSLVIFLSFDRVTAADFTTVLTGARPKLLFDLRRVPHFNLGNLNRKLVFALFQTTGTQYADLSGRMNIRDVVQPRANPQGVAELIVESGLASFLSGPIAFIVDSDQFEETYITNLIEAIPFTSEAPWDILRIPVVNTRELEDPVARNLVFISHANPEDNDFVTWLAGQLALSGYSVWSDVAKLVGGESFWDDIENTIRQQAAKVVVVLSKAAQTKPGVLDEIDLAVRVERSLGLNHFILPVKIDDLSHSQVRANLARKVIIDFSENWASGLYSLLNALERDRVPRIKSGHSVALAHWVTDRFSKLTRLVAQPEILTSNWLPIAKLPPHVIFHGVSAPIERIDKLLSSIRQPCVRYLRLIGSFAEASELQQGLDVSVSETYRINIDEFLSGRTAVLPGLLRWEAQKLCVSLLRQAWDSNMESYGLRSFQTASGAFAWYMPHNLIEGDKVEFIDPAGKRRRKSLVGWSERRQVFWHFAVEARPVLGELPRYLLKQHVIFTPDGISPIESKERMHLLRRRFCKNWWNDRWRDLLVAYVSWLTGKADSDLKAGRGSPLILDSALMTIRSPVSVGDGILISLQLEDELDSGDDGDDDAADIWAREDRETPGT